MIAGVNTEEFRTRDYNLSATLSSGQSFRWRVAGPAWVGVAGSRWVHLEMTQDVLRASVVGESQDWSWLSDYLQLDCDLNPIIASFPQENQLDTAVRACRGLRLLRQEPWECLASFILSSTKQIVQIQQVISTLCRRFGSELVVPTGFDPVWSFPSADTIARASEAELRSCKMGFRAPYLLSAARAVASGALDLAQLYNLPVQLARERLMHFPGVGRKIADCVLLFAYGFPRVFPIDVWVMRALRDLYFPGQKVAFRDLIRFSESHFGPNAGYAQQYLFHYMRIKQFEAVA